MKLRKIQDSEIYLGGLLRVTLSYSDDSSSRLRND